MKSSVIRKGARDIYRQYNEPFWSERTEKDNQIR